MAPLCGAVRLWTTRAALLSLLMCLLPSPAEGLEPGAPAISVRVYDYVGLSQQRLEATRLEVARVFERAGLATEWTNCSLSVPNPLPACQELRSPDVLILRIDSEERARALGVPGILGISWLPGEEDEHGALFCVFGDGAARVATENRIPPAVLLAHAIAHEIGHLLLRTKEHSPSGIMRARWSKNDMLRAAQGGLLFSEEEGKALRNESRVRLLPRARVEPAEGAANAR
jgi:hypothetical protein